MLIIGFVKYYALYLLGIDLLMVAIAFSFIEQMWDLRHVFPRFILLLIALILPSEWDVISIDAIGSSFQLVRQA